MSIWLQNTSSSAVELNRVLSQLGMIPGISLQNGLYFEFESTSSPFFVIFKVSPLRVTIFRAAKGAFELFFFLLDLIV